MSFKRWKKNKATVVYLDNGKKKKKKEMKYEETEINGRNDWLLSWKLLIKRKWSDTSSHRTFGL